MIRSRSAVSRAFGKAVRWQALATGAAAMLALLLGGLAAFLSALGGGLAAMLGSLAALVWIPAKSADSAGAALVTLLKAELIKIGVIALVLFAIFKLYDALVPLALIGGLAAAALVSGAALRSLDQEENT